MLVKGGPSVSNIYLQLVPCCWPGDTKPLPEAMLTSQSGSVAFHWESSLRVPKLLCMSLKSIRFKLLHFSPEPSELQPSFTGTIFIAYSVVIAFTPPILMSPWLLHVHGKIITNARYSLNLKHVKRKPFSLVICIAITWLVHTGGTITNGLSEAFSV